MLQRVSCPHCGEESICELPVRQRWHCPHCGVAFDPSLHFVDASPPGEDFSLQAEPSGAPALDLPVASGSAESAEATAGAPKGVKACPACGATALALEARCRACNASLRDVPADKAPHSSPAAVSTADDKTCPHCKTPVPTQAVLCVKCGYDFRRGYRRSVVRAEQPSPSDNDYPDVPILLRVYGALYMIFAVVMLAICALALFGSLIMAAMNDARSAPGIVCMGGLQCYFYWVLFKMGGGLTHGERSAVYGTLVLGLIAAAAGAALCAALPNPLPGIVVLALTGVLYIPPLAGAAFKWSSLH